jgi:hypothetical protein
VGGLRLYRLCGGGDGANGKQLYVLQGANCNAPFFWNVKQMWEDKDVSIARQHHCRACGNAICDKSVLTFYQHSSLYPPFPSLPTGCA